MTVLAVVAFVGTLILCARVTCPDKTRLSETQTSSPTKAFSVNVAEEFRYREFHHLGVDLLAFKACRIEKLRRGAVSFGAFNVLVLDDVTINLPTKTSGPDNVETSEDGERWSLNKLNTDDFITVFKRLQGLTEKKFSGVRVNELAVNLLENDKPERLFSVKLAEGGIGKGEHIHLEGCVIYSATGAGETIGPARIELKPTPTLVYKKHGIEQRLIF